MGRLGNFPCAWTPGTAKARIKKATKLTLTIVRRNTFFCMILSLLSPSGYYQIFHSYFKIYKDFNALSI
jgi:hypothetical protein